MTTSLPAISPTDAAPVRLRAEDPGDLLAVLPYLLGYHPTESLVMAVVSDRTIAVGVRVDLIEDPAAIADRFEELARVNRADGVLLVAYSADPAAADRLLLPTITALAEIGVIEALYADGHRWWSRICDQGCCPPEGTEYRIDDNRLAAEAVFSGLTAGSDRSAIEELVRGPAPALMPVLDEVGERMVDEVCRMDVQCRRRLIRELVDDYVGRRSAGQAVQLTDEELVRLACLVVDLWVRDEAWARITRETASFHVELWQQVVSRSEEALASAPLCLLGMAAWVAGQGTLQVCCIERMRRIDPSYSMTDLLQDINDRAIPPGFWRNVRPGLVAALDELSDESAGRLDRAERRPNRAERRPNRAERRRRARRRSRC
ncbi:DUF4192 domain-containing protein [Microlunatus elymi]|uniref:DUF4192 domain-containing protein n=1 Tax=Microlunatus elymi TaxID=2596828 RepID=A0A516PY42_9ACTN|nr:DUF4192 domain-containing protein [Microlunatus elymi]QDP96094.1 DUF4192 domain-containing protein [Microlunatus elymi]